ncbi:LolA family protein [Luteolibacter marinus]|uniref:LolA family protein n=1 Tax=Luteolibacter marinus TaxID=2776705 RepID=UPI001868989F|nr:outer membrane lipoprotein carrier protein LolA [Luteolibacter marinus]
MRLLLVFLSLVSIARAELDLAPLDAWIKRQKTLKTLDADFVQERKLPSLKKAVSTPGRMRMIRPGKLLWELGEPVKTMAVSDGSTMTLVDVSKKRGQRIDADSAKARQFTLLSNEAFRDLGSFQETFELVESRIVNGIYQITLKPKERAMRKQVAWMFLDIDTRTNELRALALELADKSRIRTIFTRTTINGKVDPAVFSPDLAGYLIR